MAILDRWVSMTIRRETERSIALEVERDAGQEPPMKPACRWRCPQVPVVAAQEVPHQERIESNRQRVGLRPSTRLLSGEDVA
jgi:hypothetical protein